MAGLRLVLALALIAVPALAVTECGRSTGSSSYVVGGTEAGVLEFPWQISLRVRNNATKVYMHNCGGSIINADWIVTAAHCVMSGPYLVVTGEHDEAAKDNPNREVHNIQKIITHPQWNMRTVDYDMALIKLSKPLDLNGKHKHLAPVCLPESDYNFENDQCVATGWGLNKHKETWEQPLRSTKLHKVTLTVNAQRMCTIIYRNVNTITDRMMCAGRSTQGFGVCNGDSGGPLQCKKDNKYTLAGLSSYVVRCGSGVYPSVFARVAAFRVWMQGVMNSN